MKKLAVLLFVFLTLSINAVEVTGTVRKLYVQSGRIYFMLSETSSTKCHDTSNSYYYYIETDKTCTTTDSACIRKKFTADTYFQLLLLSANSRSSSISVPVTITLYSGSYPSKCQSSHILIDGLKVY